MQPLKSTTLNDCLGFIVTAASSWDEITLLISFRTGVIIVVICTCAITKLNFLSHIDVNGAFMVIKIKSRWHSVQDMEAVINVCMVLIYSQKLPRDYVIIAVSQKSSESLHWGKFPRSQFITYNICDQK